MSSNSINPQLSYVQVFTDQLAGLVRIIWSTMRATVSLLGHDKVLHHLDIKLVLLDLLEWRLTPALARTGFYWLREVTQPIASLAGSRAAFYWFGLVLNIDLQTLFPYPILKTIDVRWTADIICVQSINIQWRADKFSYRR